MTNLPIASDAERLRKRLVKQGIPIGSFAADHVLEVYAGLSRSMTPINHDALMGCIPSQTDPIFVDEIVGVIVETRPLPNLPIIAGQIQDLLKIPIHVFCSQDNYEFVLNSKIGDMINKRQACVTVLGIKELNRDLYTALMTYPPFWNNVRARRKILVFQTDASICGCAKHPIKDFLDLDYVGSGWSRRRPEGILVDGGNGGLSLRDWSMTMDCLKRFPPKNWRGGEDTYYCFHLDLIGKVAKESLSFRFGTQFDFVYKSFGAHKLDCLNCFKQILFLIYCPNAYHIITRHRELKRTASALLRVVGFGALISFILQCFRKRRYRQKQQTPEENFAEY